MGFTAVGFAFNAHPPLSVLIPLRIVVARIVRELFTGFFTSKKHEDTLFKGEYIDTNNYVIYTQGPTARSKRRRPLPYLCNIL